MEVDRDVVVDIEIIGIENVVVELAVAIVRDRKVTVAVGFPV